MEQLNSSPSSPPPDTIIEGRDLMVVKSGRTILNIPHIYARQGEVLAIIGPNGAGKSTLLTTLACLEFPRRGAVFFEGRKVTRKNALTVRRQMSVVFQEPLLLDGTVLENIKIGLSLRGHLKEGYLKAKLKRWTHTTNEEIYHKISFWLDRFGLTHLSNQMAHTLSGGEAQRASLARAFVLEPKVLFLDEPFASLDAITRQDLISQLKTVLDESGTTTILVTHDFREVEALAHRVIILDQGKIQAEGVPREIKDHPSWKRLTSIKIG